MKVLLGPFANPEDGPKVSRGLRGLSTGGKQSALTTQEEYKRLQAEAAQIEQWWADKQRWGHTRRPYSGKHTKNMTETAVMHPTSYHSRSSFSLRRSHGRCVPSSFTGSSCGTRAFSQV
jgi:hypothetical protein